MAKRKKHNPERKAWRGRSHKKGGKRVKELREFDRFQEIKNFLKGGPGSAHTVFYEFPDKVEIQFWGWAVVLLKDGTWFVTDTSGG
jgi:hypothetical protein